MKFYDGGAGGSVEDVTAPGDSSDQLLGIIPQRAPDFDQALSQGIVGDCSFRPDSLDQFRFRDQPVRTLHQIGQYFKRLGPQSDFLVAPQQETTVQIKNVLPNTVETAPNAFRMWSRKIQLGLLTGLRACQL